MKKLLLVFILLLFMSISVYANQNSIFEMEQELQFNVETDSFTPDFHILNEFDGDPNDDVIFDLDNIPTSKPIYMRMPTFSTSKFEFGSTDGQGGYTLEKVITAAKVSNSYCKGAPTSPYDYVEDGILMYTTDHYMDKMQTYYNQTFIKHLWITIGAVGHKVEKYAGYPDFIRWFAESDVDKMRFMGQRAAFIRFHSHLPSNIEWSIYSMNKANTEMIHTSEIANIKGCYEVKGRDLDNYYWLSIYIGKKYRDVGLKTITTYRNVGNIYQRFVLIHTPQKHPSVWASWLKW